MRKHDVIMGASKALSRRGCIHNICYEHQHVRCLHIIRLQTEERPAAVHITRPEEEKRQDRRKRERRWDGRCRKRTQRVEVSGRTPSQGMPSEQHSHPQLQVNSTKRILHTNLTCHYSPEVGWVRRGSASFLDYGVVPRAKN